MLLLGRFCDIVYRRLVPSRVSLPRPPGVLAGERPGHTHDAVTRVKWVRGLRLPAGLDARWAAAWLARGSCLLLRGVLNVTEAVVFAKWKWPHVRQHCFVSSGFRML